MAAKKKKQTKYNPADKFVGDASEMKMYDANGREVPFEPQSFAELPYDVDDKGNPIQPPDEG